MKNQKSLAWQIIKRLTKQIKIQKIIIVFLFVLVCILSLLLLGISGGI